MSGVAAQYAQWLGTAAADAGGAATHAKAIAGIFEAAKSAITHRLAVAANRVQLVNLVRSILFGFNAPAIAATEGAYEGDVGPERRDVGGLSRRGFGGGRPAGAVGPGAAAPGRHAAQPAPAASPASSVTVTQVSQGTVATNQPLFAQLRTQTQTGIFVLKQEVNSGINLARADLGSGAILKGVGVWSARALLGPGC